MRVETKKILDPAIELTATCVRVPVFVGHSEAVNVELAGPMSAKQAKEILRESPGIMLVDDPKEELYITPKECVGEWATYISRVRVDPTVENGLAFWCVSETESYPIECGSNCRGTPEPRHTETGKTACRHELTRFEAIIGWLFLMAQC